MKIITRILITLPMAVGAALLFSASSELLDAYKASEKYRENTETIIRAVAESKQLNALLADQGLNSRIDGYAQEMNKGSFESLRNRFHGGAILILVGGLIISLYYKKYDSKAAYEYNQPSRQNKPRHDNPS